jgi:murein DD-endopeptidase MepM/ murein hydrolase activator NlpD
MYLARRAVTRLLPVSILAAVLFVTTPAQSVTQAEVDAACSDSRGAYGRYKQERLLLDEATQRYENTYGELESTVLRESYLRTLVTARTGEVIDIRQRVQKRAVEMYITASVGMTDVLFSSTSVGQLLATRQFIQTATERDVASLDRLQAIRQDLDGLRDELQAEEVRLGELRDQQEIVKNTLDDVVHSAETNWRELSSKCKELERKRRAEIARRQALEAARRKGAGAGIPASLTPNFYCPMDPGVTSFTNSWGAPRSGGRTHKGTDMFAPYGQRVLAVSDGVVTLGNGGLGGISVWLRSDDGYAVYYAHLSGWAPGLSNGQRVGRGQLIAYNGNSGNARGTSAHVHLQIHPGGRGASPVNPYPTLMAYGCR